MSKKETFQKSVIALLLTFAFLSQAYALRNGQLVTDNSFQQVARLWIDDVPCSATLIGPKVFITAAHCRVIMGTMSKVSIEIGIKGLSGHQILPVNQEKILKHPNYDNVIRGENDIALGVLNKSVKGIKPISISTEKLKIGEPVIMAGWGSDIQDYSLRSGQNIIGNYYETFMETGPSVGGSVSEPGDSGGPVFKVYEGQLFLVSVIRGSVDDITGTTPMSLQASQDFLKSYASTNKVHICGITKQCP